MDDSHYSDLQLQKEATGKSHKSDKVMFLDWTISIFYLYSKLEQKHSSCSKKKYLS